MKQTKELTIDALHKIAKACNHDGSRIFPLIEQEITLAGKSTHLHIYKLGDNGENFEVSDLLVYVDGFGGVTTEVKTKLIFKNKKTLPIGVIIKGSTLKLQWGLSIHQVQRDLTWREGWGYVDAENAFVRIDALPAAPLFVEKTTAECTELIEEIAFLHPNLIVMRPDDMEHALLLFNEDCSQYVCLHDNWSGFDAEDEDDRESYATLVSIIDEAVNIYTANQAFDTWWNNKRRK